MRNSVSHIELIMGDITKARVDAIVNAANQEMLGGGGVDGAIHKAAGPILLEYCKRCPAVDGIRCPTGEARITPAGSLMAKFVIHTVGPVYGVDPDPEVLLANAYQASLDLAITNGCQSVALPALSCGVYAFPWEKAATIAFATCTRMPFQKLSLTFYLSGPEIMHIWSQALTKIN
ncbi:MAG: macro domain-containing protein [Gammaproteobacteria bacterium]|nr:macro domain-containing protein [Gammaproteobacteria bacterium]